MRELKERKSERMEFRKSSPSSLFPLNLSIKKKKKKKNACIARRHIFEIFKCLMDLCVAGVLIPEIEDSGLYYKPEKILESFEC